MKRYFTITTPLLLLISFILSGCNQWLTIEIHGLDNFNAMDCSYSTTRHLLPGEDFIAKFPYEDGDYRYWDGGFAGGWGYATACAYMRYSEENYVLAKDYCLENFTFCQEHTAEFNGYTFMTIQQTDAISKSEVHTTCRRPELFNLFVYNDTSATLVFLGYYNGDKDSAERALLDTDLKAFLESAFLSDYSFEIPQDK